jgi:hypothetical protein
MEFLEKHLEDIIYDAFRETNYTSLRFRGLTFLRPGMTVYRQFKVAGYGVIDLLFVDVTRDRFRHTDGLMYNSYSVQLYPCELKKGPIDYAALGQVYRYVKALSAMACYSADVAPVVIDDVSINPILIGRELDKTNDLVYVMAGLSELRIYTYKYAVDGLAFKEVEPDTYRSTREDTTPLFEEAEKFPLYDFLLRKAKYTRSLLNKFRTGSPRFPKEGGSL